MQLPASKSESNRALIIRAMSGNQIAIEHLSAARDTQTLAAILERSSDEVNVLDAGTGMRFLTAYYAATGQHKVITGSTRMQQRPMHPLINALCDLGFHVRCRMEEGFPPLEIFPVGKDEVGSVVFIEGNISSQFITALLLIAPALPNGLTIHFTTPLTSEPYIDMTLQMLAHFGVKHERSATSISIRNTQYAIRNYKIGGDWSAASYWYSIAFLAAEARITLQGLRDEWTQGDRIMADWMKRFGVYTEFSENGATLRKVQADYPRVMKLNFTGNPDLAQTFAVMFAAGGVISMFSGLESLRVKETDRIAALQTELAKCNIRLDYLDEFVMHQLRGEFSLPTMSIATYNDHRMAMSFAPLALFGEIEIEKPEVVVKSYPAFWEDLQSAGFVLG